MVKKDTKILVRISKHTKKALKIEAILNEVTLSELIRRKLKNYEI